MELISVRPAPHHGGFCISPQRIFGDSGTRARPGWGTTISQQARKKLGLRRLPQLLADADSPAKTATACDAIAKTVKTIIFFTSVLA
jgi:hypothetical protein